VSAGSLLSAEQLLIQPSFYGYSFEGPALRLECVATLKRGEEGLTASFRLKSAGERRLCLDQLLQSLPPEPDFTADDFRRALKQNAQGDYFLDSGRAMGDRLGVNIGVASGIAALALVGLIDDAAVMPPLVECLNHPLLDVARSCNRALESLTRHSYGSRFFERSMGAPGFTVANHQRVVADWRALLLDGRHPIYDDALQAASQAVVRSVVAGLLPVVPPSPARGYLDAMSTRAEIGRGSWDEEIVRFDVGRHNAANWSDDRITRIALLMIRPGPSRLDGNADFQNADYRERFDALDLEVRFSIGTSDEAVRGRSVQAVRRALDELRAANTKAAR
jgi:hypothetical protein